jgi:hypothetical protein
MNRLTFDIIWTDDTHIRVLVNNRDAWRGGREAVDLLKQLEELDYITLREHQDETTYLNSAKANDRPS